MRSGQIDICFNDVPANFLALLRTFVRSEEDLNESRRGRGLRGLEDSFVGSVRGPSLRIDCIPSS